MIIYITQQVFCHNMHQHPEDSSILMEPKDHPLDKMVLLQCPICGYEVTLSMNQTYKLNKE